MTILGIFIVLILITLLLTFIGVKLTNKYTDKKVNDLIEDMNGIRNNENLVKYTETELRLAFFSGINVMRKNPEAGLESSYQQFKKDHFYKED